MKSALVLLLPLLVSGASVKQEIYRRKEYDLFGLSNGDKTLQKPISVKKLEAVSQKDAIREQVVWGPFKIQSTKENNVGDGSVLNGDQNSNIISTRVAGICRDCMVLNAKAELSNEHGDTLDLETGIHSRQILITDIGHPMILPPALAQCPDGRLSGLNFAEMINGLSKDSDETSQLQAMESYQAQAPPPSGTSSASITTTVPSPKTAASSLSVPSSTTFPTSVTNITSVLGPTTIPSLFEMPGLTGPFKLPPSVISMLPKDPAAVMGGLAGAVLGAALLAAIGAVIGSGIGVVLSSEDGVSKLANLIPKMPPLDMSIFIRHAGENSALDFSSKSNAIKSGYWIGTKDEINIMSEVINYNNETRDIYVKVEYEYLPMLSRPAEYLDVGTSSINIAPCESVNSVLPKDRAVKYTSPPWYVIQDGFLLDIKPQLRDGGMNMTLFVNEQMKCSSQAVYGETDNGLASNGQKWETITSFTECPNPIPIKLGDKLTMEAHYDLTRHKLRPTSDNKGVETEGIASANFLYAKPHSDRNGSYR